MSYSVQDEIGGRTLRIETGKLAEQANGAVTVRYGDTVVLVTACSSQEPRDTDFIPLTVDYEERLYAAGKIPGSFFRREGRPSQEAVLTSRLTDRPLRPLFPKELRHEVQIIVTVFSADQENDPDILAIIGASSAVCISDIPFAGPVSASRVGYIDGEYVLNPTFAELARSKLDLVVAGTEDGAIMVEAEAREVPEEIALGAIDFGQAANRKVLKLQEQLMEAAGKTKWEVRPKATNGELYNQVALAVKDKLAEGITWSTRPEREAVLSKLREELIARLSTNYSLQEINSTFEASMKAAIRDLILKRGKRPDGRGPTDIRPIFCEVGTLPRTHGSGLFKRGQTQVLTIATLGTPGEEQHIDGLGLEETKRFMHHYNFPPFSTGEAKRIGVPGRREIGHGALAERALVPVLPDEAEFPYTIRLVSEVLSSNGSTSMASVCGSTLSLMDAGVPIKSPVAGIAMGLVMGTEGEYAILTDIEGLEDALGDMDFKVAGTAEGITALQLDLKVKSVASEQLAKGLAQAKDARFFVLDKMRETISASRAEISRYAPRLTKIRIDPEKIRHVIGPGGKTIRSIMSETKVTIDVENDGTVLIGSPSEEATQKAIRIIDDLTRDVEVGGIYTGRVTRTTNFGAFVEILPGKEGLVHISELADYRAPSVEEVVRIGDEVMVMVTEIDRLGRINLSRKAVLQNATPVPGAAAAGERREVSGYPARTPDRRRPREEGGSFGRRHPGDRPKGPRGPAR